MFGILKIYYKYVAMKVKFRNSLTLRYICLEKSPFPKKIFKIYS